MGEEEMSRPQVANRQSNCELTLVTGGREGGRSMRAE